MSPVFGLPGFVPPYCIFLKNIDVNAPPLVVTPLKYPLTEGVIIPAENQPKPDGDNSANVFPDPAYNEFEYNEPH